MNPRENRSLKLMRRVVVKFGIKYFVYTLEIHNTHL